MGTRGSDLSRYVTIVALFACLVVSGPAGFADEIAQLTNIVVDESEPGIAHLRFEFDRTPSWASYRDESGALVFELANTVAATFLEIPPIVGGVIQGVDIDSDPRGPVTRVRIADGDTEHEVVPVGRTLDVIVRSLGQGEEMAMEVESQEATPETATEAAEEVGATAIQPYGTAESPFRSPEPSGAGSEVLAIEAATAADDVAVYIRGDGTFEYSAFSLDDPSRFVLDLKGAVVGIEERSIGIDEAGVKQVRVGQFSDSPEPIARVVFDLWSATVPWVETVADGVVVRFGADSPEAAQVDLAVADEAEVVGDAFETESAVVETAAVEMAEVETTEPAIAEPAVAELEAEPDQEQAIAEVPISEVPIPEGAEIVDTASDEAEIDEDATSTAQLLEIAETESGPTEDATQVDSEPVVVDVEPMVVAEVVPVDEQVEIPEYAAAATSSAYLSEQELTVTTGEATSDPNPAAGFGSVPVGGERRYSGEPIDLSLQDSDVRDVLRSLAQLSGLNLVVQPGVSGRVTVEFVQVPWDQALEQILKINGLGYEVEGTIMRVAPLDQLRQEAEERQRLAQARAAAVPLTTVIQRVSYARAAAIARALGARGGVMSSRGSVIVDDRTNTLIIKELPAYIDTVLSVVESLDIPEPQVMIEARIIETTKRFTRTLGIDWGFSGVADNEHGNTTGLVFPNNVQADGGVSLLTGARNGFLDLSLGNVLNTFNLDIALQAAENEGLINILSEPKVLILNNERAIIQSGLQIPIQTVANNTVSVQFVNATLRLEVTPQVTADGTVLMEVRIQKREPQPAFAVAGAANAPIATKEAETRVIVRDGGTTVIGGIYEVSSDDGEDRVPGLGKVKGVGHLFKNRRRNNENQELLIFITPRVVRL